MLHKNDKDILMNFPISFVVGKIIDVELAPKTRKPSYLMQADFGVFGKKTSVGQLTHYKQSELKGKHFVAAVNLGPRKIAGIASEYLTVGFYNAHDEAMCLSFHSTTPPGTVLYETANPQELTEFQQFLDNPIQAGMIKYFELHDKGTTLKVDLGKDQVQTLEFRYKIMNLKQDEILAFISKTKQPLGVMIKDNAFEAALVDKHAIHEIKVGSLLG
jgi:tRNA-binding protein